MKCWRLCVFTRLWTKTKKSKFTKTFNNEKVNDSDDDDDDDDNDNNNDRFPKIPFPFFEALK